MAISSEMSCSFPTLLQLSTKGEGFGSSFPRGHSGAQPSFTALAVFFWALCVHEHLPSPGQGACRESVRWSAWSLRPLSLAFQRWWLSGELCLITPWDRGSWTRWAGVLVPLTLQGFSPPESQSPRSDPSLGIRAAHQDHPMYPEQLLSQPGETPIPDPEKAFGSP